jgi:hypothetical protein
LLLPRAAQHVRLLPTSSAWPLGYCASDEVIGASSCCCLDLQFLPLGELNHLHTDTIVMTHQNELNKLQKY